MGCDCKIPKHFTSEQNQGKSFNFGPWNESKIYSNDSKVQDFVYYENALYAYINSDESSFGQNPKLDTMDGVQTGKYWLQLFAQPEVDYGTVKFMADPKGFLKISYDDGFSFGYLLDDAGNRISVKTGQKGEDGKSTRITSVDADISYCESIFKPEVSVEEFGNRFEKDLIFHFKLPIDACNKLCTVTVEADPYDAEIEINGVKTNVVTVRYGTELHIVASKESCGTKEACYTATKTETILIKLN